MKKKPVKICPKCKSENISPDFSARIFGQGYEFNASKCNDCGYAGIFFPEVDTKKAKKK
jgi:predicted RNA-binding Zn-ribbon protein involved in translation (DUF1610 family)